MITLRKMETYRTSERFSVNQFSSHSILFEMFTFNEICTQFRLKYHHRFIWRFPHYLQCLGDVAVNHVRIIRKMEPNCK